MALLNNSALHASAVVANCDMNRERRLTGTNGYERDLGLKVMFRHTASNLIAT